MFIEEWRIYRYVSFCVDGDAFLATSYQIEQMKLIIDKIISNREIVHYSDPNLLITSYYNRIFVNKEGNTYDVQLPDDDWKRVFRYLRLTRRAARLDKCNVVPVGDNLEDLVIIRRGCVYHFCSKTKLLKPKLYLRNCRNILHQSVAVVDKKNIYFGEYGNNPNRLEVPVYRSMDGGRSWEEIYKFESGTIRHIHGCYWDSYEEKIWVFTGDFSNECFVLVADRNFDKIEWLGNGQQKWRTCNAFFEKDAIYWIMDSPLETNYCMKLDRSTRKLTQLGSFPGPVWYIKRLADGFYLAATTCEIGPGVHDEYSHLYISKNAEKWKEIYKFKHDRLPKRYFKFGVVGFADGQQGSNRFYIFGEALKGLDGKVALCQLE